MQSEGRNQYRQWRHQYFRNGCGPRKRRPLEGREEKQCGSKSIGKPAQRGAGGGIAPLDGAVEGLAGTPVVAVWGQVFGGVGGEPDFPISKVSGSRDVRRA